MKERVTILGATGSIGKSTADVLLSHRNRFEVAAVVSGSDAAGLAAMAKSLGASFAAISDASKLEALRAALDGSGIACGAGESAVLEAVALEADLVVAAISGAAGLVPTHAALKKGRRIALANKESLVCAGECFMRDAAAIGAEILPLDSEHNTLKQALGGGDLRDVVTMTLTASGGPFRTASIETMRTASAAQAAAHPTWSMGAKINIDSASLMNKGLELIEAHHLFRLRPDQLDVVVHPQSVIHGLVHWRDGSVTAGLYLPDMRVPIANCFGTDRRIAIEAKTLDLAKIGSFTFEAPDEVRFPCLRLARDAMAAGGAMPAVLNGANEVAVAAFLGGSIGFLDIPRIVADTCATAIATGPAPDTVEEALAIDREARAIATELLRSGPAVQMRGRG